MRAFIRFQYMRVYLVIGAHRRLGMESCHEAVSSAQPSVFNPFPPPLICRSPPQ